MKTWFTSDTHYDHANIIKCCNRPFRSVEEMNETMIKRYNERVSVNDVVWHLGDFSMRANKEKIAYLRTRLNGRINIIRGNHDIPLNDLRNIFDYVSEYEELKINSKRLVLSHYAMRVWNGSFHGSWMLYGHSHGNLAGNSQSLDVGVDCWDFCPISLEEIEVRLKTLPAFREKDA